ARGLRLPIAATPPERLFADDRALPGWARDSIYALSSREILQGRSGHRFEPAAPVTFAEALVVLLRAVDLAELH
ncbi:S-layer homology domain-containing protein, partial [Paenibacillus sp. 598K]|uniref:S-layer homology domain-containing protein n=1 Tax=Paenibacillus sp. 598K TaxID=1117987 RepID=UPI001628741B